MTCPDHQFGHVHNARGKCSCGSAVDLVCHRCGVAISAQRFDENELCDDCDTVAYHEALSLGWKLLEDRWPS